MPTQTIYSLNPLINRCKKFAFYQIHKEKASQIRAPVLNWVTCKCHRVVTTGLGGGFFHFYSIHTATFWCGLISILLNFITFPFFFVACLLSDMFLFALLSVQRFYFYFHARVSPSVHFQICTKWKCLLIAAFWRALRHFKGLHLYLTLLADRATDAIYLHDSLFLFVYVFVWWMWVNLRAILRNVLLCEFSHFSVYH